MPKGGGGERGDHAWNLLSHSSSVGTYFCGSLEKSEKLEPAKISCHTLYALVTVIRVVKSIEKLQEIVLYSLFSLSEFNNELLSADILV